MDRQFIRCPLCHRLSVVEVDVLATANTKGEVTFSNNENISDLVDVDRDVDEYDMDFSYDYGSFRCGSCEKYLADEEIIVGRNEYLDEARQEEKELTKEEGQPCLF